MTGNFEFLKTQWPDLYETAAKAEKNTFTDPWTCALYCRFTLEQTVKWIYDHDSSLKRPFQDNLGALLMDKDFVQNLGSGLALRIRFIQQLGNHAAHKSRNIRDYESLKALQALHALFCWLTRTYSKNPPRDLLFKETRIPKKGEREKSAKQLEQLQDQLAEKNKLLEDERKKYADLLERQKEAFEKEKQRLLEIQQIKIFNEKTLPEEDYTEEETRELFIDLLLREAGWDTNNRDVSTEYEVSGMPSKSGKGSVDYVLWGKDGLPLAVVEAKRTKLSEKKGKYQAQLYADCLEKSTGQRPVIFYTNGYNTWLWDDAFYPPREVRGFYTADQLQLLILRRTTRKPLKDMEIDTSIVNRNYHYEGIRRVTEDLSDGHRKGLVVMATGAGKTQFSIALVKLLMQANWVRRVLFLADRISLTATPKAEVDRNTYSLFDLSDNMPTHFYELEKAVREGYLVPFKAMAVPLKFPQQGIRYDDLSEDEKEEYEAEFYDDRTGEMPKQIKAAHINKWLFNNDTIDKVLAHLMEYGLRVQGGDRLGKTIIFAKNQEHADFIVKRFDKLFPRYKGGFTRTIHHAVDYSHNLIDEFSLPDKNPIIAVSVDMLDTGIDIHEIVNLVFFKNVWSRSKFRQMLGRGTRTRKNLFGPGKDKEYFLVFDFCRNFAFFEENPEGIEPAAVESLSQKIFKKRLFLTHHLGDARVLHDPDKRKLRGRLTEILHRGVKELDCDSFLVRPHRKYVEKYIRDNEDHLTIIKLKTNKPITALDLEQLERMLFETSEIGTRDDFLRAYGTDRPLGPFIRSIVGLDRDAVKEAFARFTANPAFSADQITFIDYILDYFSRNGYMKKDALWSQPFTDLHDHGPLGIFSDGEVDNIISIIDVINQNAVGM
jgi:type I site-specific restriction endonuclease